MKRLLLLAGASLGLAVSAPAMANMLGVNVPIGNGMCATFGITADGEPYILDVYPCRREVAPIRP